jgi:hypothetical protein
MHELRKIKKYSVLLRKDVATTNGAQQDTYYEGKTLLVGDTPLQRLNSTRVPMGN